MFSGFCVGSGLVLITEGALRGETVNCLVGGTACLESGSDAGNDAFLYFRLAEVALGAAVRFAADHAYTPCRLHLAFTRCDFEGALW